MVAAICVRTHGGPGQLVLEDTAVPPPGAGAVRVHPTVLIIGLMLSISLMGLAASFIARLLQKHRWIAYVGLAIILYVALEMIYRGILEVWPVVV